MYNITNLKENLESKIFELGINEDFKNNPAFYSILDEINSLLDSIHVIDNFDSIVVKKNDKYLSFSFSTSSSDKYSMVIGKSQSNSFRCVTVHDNTIDNINTKEAIEIITTLNDRNEINMNINTSIITNKDHLKPNNSISSLIANYDENGIMYRMENRIYPDTPVVEDIKTISTDSMLLIARQIYNNSFWENKFMYRTLLVRDKLDTARVVVDDNENGIKYRSTLPLETSHGLMNIHINLKELPQEVNICEISTEEINELINRETNPKVRNGLKKYAKGRENYSYTSIDNLDFVYDCDIKKPTIFS